jgi:CRISPR-associated exonuclease Cas4
MMESHYLSIDKPITGTLMWYYAICKREVWLMARELVSEQDSAILDFGRAVHEVSYEGLESKEIGFEGVKFDLYFKGKKMVCEVKTSSKFLEATKLQVKYYLYRLKEKGIESTGIIAVPRERRRYKITLEEEDIDRLNKIFNDIRRIVSLEKPPPAKKTPFCRKCTYKDFCWV